MNNALCPIEKEALNRMELKPLEKLSLRRNSRSYSWDIQISGIDIDRIEQINNEMIKKFKSGGGEK